MLIPTYGANNKSTRHREPQEKRQPMGKGGEEEAKWEPDVKGVMTVDRKRRNTGGTPCMAARVYLSEPGLAAVGATGNRNGRGGTQGGSDMTAPRLGRERPQAPWGP
ncbi:hypothetical protein AAFF_G00040760 [Aldrovandia affinis]|uniref:Uncharacterized protein n=1 Tax=Aldrovandia affinis TaxID=143900 RepID=A0AAD7S343_9TELE|nr:hypothetical protein AAFF_G00040760 [Aldrovandia affinis]